MQFSTQLTKTSVLLPVLGCLKTRFLGPPHQNVRIILGKLTKTSVLPPQLLTKTSSGTPVLLANFHLVLFSASIGVLDLARKWGRGLRGGSRPPSAITVAFATNLATGFHLPPSFDGPSQAGPNCVPVAGDFTPSALILLPWVGSSSGAKCVAGRQSSGPHLTSDLYDRGRIPG